MSITVVQTAQNTGTGTGSPSVTVTLGSATAAGNCLAVTVVCGGTSVNPSVSGITLGGSADNFGSLISAGTGGGDCIISFWADPDCAGGATSVTVSTTGGSGTACVTVSVLEVSGLASTLAGLLDVHSVHDSSSASSSSWTSGTTGTTTQPDELAVGLVGTFQNLTITGDPGFTNLAQQSGGTAVTSMTGYGVLSSEVSGDYAGTFSVSYFYVAGLISLRGAAAPSSPAALLQAASGGAVSEYGFGTTAIGTREGSWLALLAAWNCVTPGTYVQVPALSVTDSAGNLWRQAGMSAAGGTASTRAAVWVCPNALPVTWVSAGLTGFAASLAWTVAEISGMPQDASVDFSVSASAGGTAPSLSWTASEAGIGFAVLGAGNAAETIASPPSGWTALGTATAGSAVTGAAAFSYWNTDIAAGSATTALALGTAASYSWVLCSLSASASPPPQQNPLFPLVSVEAAFGAQPGNVSASTDYLFSPEYASWTDLTPRAIGPAVSPRIKAKLGRQYQLQQEETGTAEIPLSNVDGALTPTNPGSPFYSNAINSNMSFQSGLSPWTVQGGAAAGWSPAQAFASGLNAVSRGAALVTCGTAASAGIASELVPVNPNYPCTASAWVYAGTAYAGGAETVISWYGTARSFLSSVTGGPVAVPARQWTPVVTQGGTPPAGAAYAQATVQAEGSPGAGYQFWIAEAALVTGSAPVQTGLVAPLVPVRVTGWYQGRRYPVWAGYAQQWPQEWPDLPQWGFSPLKAADALGVAAAGQMQSALVGEVLADNPYAYFPCNETYTTNITGVTTSNPYLFSNGYYEPADANGLPAVNRADGNQVTGTYLDGSSQQASTGLAMNFLGDDGTGTGATGYQSVQFGSRGPSMLYSDPGLSAVGGSPAGWTAEFWFSWGGTAGTGVSLLSAYGAPSAFMRDNSAPTANGNLLTAYIDPGDGAFAVETPSGGLATGGAQPASQSPQHCVITFSPGTPSTVSLWLNGTLVEATTGLGGAPPGTGLAAIVLGCGRYSYDCSDGGTYFAYNYAAGHLAVYPYQLPASRITAHWLTGSTGQSGAGAAQRFSQVFTWAQLGLKRGGWSQASANGTAEVTQIGPAYGLSGQSPSAAVYALSQSEGGRYGTQANGSVFYAERNSLYNQPVSAVFSDGTAAAPGILNADPGFATGTAGWTATGGSVSASPANAYGSLGSLALNPSGTAALLAASPQFTWNGGSSTAGFWLKCPAGGTVVTGAASSAGTAAGTAVLSPGAWTFASVPVPAGTATSAHLFVQYAGSLGPAYAAWVAMWYSPGPVPYSPKSSYGFDTTYVYNEIAATQQDGPNQLALYDARGTVSQARFFRRSALSFTPNTVSPYDVSDLATWSLGAYQDPSLHVSGVMVDAAPNPLQAFPVILPLAQGQVGQVNRTPVGGAPLSETGTVERVQHEIGAGYWRMTCQLSPYGPAQAAMCADTPGFDAPGTASSLVIAW